MFGLLLFLYSLIVLIAPCLFHSYTTSLDSYNKFPRNNLYGKTTFAGSASIRYKSIPLYNAELNSEFRP
jgi:hypothetical protein